MKKNQISRRNFLHGAAQLTVVGGVVGLVAGCSSGEEGAAGPATVACVDPDNLSSSEQSMRQSINYVAPYEDPNEVCRLCVYFHADTPGCGNCEILHGIVSEQGHCVSWAPHT